MSKNHPEGESPETQITLAPGAEMPPPVQPVFDDAPPAVKSFEATASHAWIACDAIHGIVAAIPPQTTDPKLMKARESAVKAWQQMTTAAQALAAAAKAARKGGAQ